MWQIYNFGNNCKPHVMRADAERSSAAVIVCNDLISRNCPLVGTEGVTKTHLDCPGIIISGRPYSEFEVHGLKVDIACENVHHFFTYMTSLKDRGGYYKIHSWHHCLVLNPTDFHTLLGRIESGLADADKRDNEFYNAWKAKHAGNRFGRSSSSRVN